MTKNYGEKIYNVFDPEYNNNPQLNRINWEQYKNLNRFNKKVDAKPISYLIFILMIIFLLIRFPFNVYELLKIIL